MPLSSPRRRSVAVLGSLFFLLLAAPALAAFEAAGTIDAPFTAHGATETVRVEYTVRKSKAGWNIRAKFPFDISRHGIEVPSYLGVTVDATMRAEVVIDVVDR